MTAHDAGWWLQDVAAQAAMDIAKALSLRADGLTEPEIQRAFAGLDKTYVRRGIGLLEALGLARQDAPKWLYAGDARLRGASRNEGRLFFAAALQKYPPFVSYATLLTQGYWADEAAAMVRGVYGLGPQTTTVRKAMTSWGRYGELLDDAGNPVVEPLDKLSLSVLHKLISATQSHLQANMFVAAELGHELMEELARLGTGPEDIAEGVPFISAALQTRSTARPRLSSNCSRLSRWLVQERRLSTLDNLLTH